MMPHHEAARLTTVAGTWRRRKAALEHDGEWPCGLTRWRPGRRDDTLWRPPTPGILSSACGDSLRLFSTDGARRKSSPFLGYNRNGGCCLPFFSASSTSAFDGLCSSPPQLRARSPVGMYSALHLRLPLALLRNPRARPLLCSLYSTDTRIQWTCSYPLPLHARPPDDLSSAPSPPIVARSAPPSTHAQLVPSNILPSLLLRSCDALDRLLPRWLVRSS